MSGTAAGEAADFSVSRACLARDFPCPTVSDHGVGKDQCLPAERAVPNAGYSPRRVASVSEDYEGGMTPAAMAAPTSTPTANTATAMISLVAWLSTGSSSSVMGGSTIAAGSSALIIHVPSTTAPNERMLTSNAAAPRRRQSGLRRKSAAGGLDRLQDSRLLDG